MINNKNEQTEQSIKISTDCNNEDISLCVMTNESKECNDIFRKMKTHFIHGPL